MANRSMDEPLVSGVGQLGVAAADEIEAVKAVPARSNLGLAWYRFRRHRMALVGSALLLAVLVGCLIVPFFFPPDAANATSFDVQEPPSPSHLLGTDEDVRDIALRLLVAGRVSLAVGFAAIGGATEIGRAHV